MRVLILLALTSLAAAGCSDTCQRDACDELNSPASPGTATSIAGVIASESDVVENGCQECSFASAKLELWKVPSAVDSASAAKAVIAAASPALTISAVNRYSQALDAGLYLFCQRPYCVNVTAVENKVTTVHLRLINGPTTFVIYDESRTAQRPAPMEVGFE